ncbi:HD 3 domain containing protein [Trichuris trichiura]|uniref:5'-deoxynucleotidase HDDC2 n=1 Tax=Trichuris trichiura TaxID=36087 RepID=A0A077Z9V5_TRITR|nr:HD 3 domain containing protein [Trichuris trichiura]
MCDNVLTFCEFLARLKHLPRTGWVNNNVRNPETVAGHMYRMAMLMFCVDTKKEGVDFNHCVKMALVHDLAESIIGDITPACNISKQAKFQWERAAMEKICEFVVANMADQVIRLFDEFERGMTKEAMLVRDLDKFDMLEQAMEYEKNENRPGELRSFLDCTVGVFVTDTVNKWAAKVRERYAEFSGTTSAFRQPAKLFETAPSCSNRRE